MFKEVTAEQKKETYALIVQRCKFRFQLSVVLILGFTFSHTLPAEYLFLVYALFPYYLLLNGAILGALRRQSLPYPLRHSDVALDTVMLAFLVYATGGVQSPLIFGYFFITLFMSTTHSYRGTIIATVAAGVSFLVGSYMHDRTVFDHVPTIARAVNVILFLGLFSLFNTSVIKRLVRHKHKLTILQGKYDDAVNVPCQSSRSGASLSPEEVTSKA